MQTQFSIDGNGTTLAKTKDNKEYLRLSVLEAGFHDARTIPVFAKPWIDAAAEYISKDLDVPNDAFDHLLKNNQFDKERVDLGGAYWHFRIDENGAKVYDTLSDGTKRVYTTISVVVLYHTQEEVVYDENDVPMFVPGVFDPKTGKPIYLTRTVREKVQVGDTIIRRDKRFYQEGFSPQERRDDVLKTYFEKATTQAQQTQAQVQPIISGDPNQQPAGGAIVNPI